MIESPMKTRHVVIIGAPRSGTNMLRDSLTSLENIGTWPCDEINYIWRHGNVRFPTDEFTADMAKTPIKHFIRGAFQHIAHQQQIQFVVEKTCANTLRVPFVDQILPKSTYIYIYRDGIDAAGSAIKRWTANLDIPYILRKARYVPLYDFPYYAGRYFINHLHRLASQEERLAFWGPLFDGYQEALEKFSLPEVCALQWKRCVDLAEEGFHSIDPERVIRVRYETFVSKPVAEMQRIVNQLGIQSHPDEIRQSVREVTARSIGKGRKELSDEDLRRIHQHIASSLERYGYH